METAKKIRLERELNWKVGAPLLFGCAVQRGGG